MSVRKALVVYYYPKYQISELDASKHTIATIENRGVEQFLEIEKDGVIYLASVEKNKALLTNRTDKLDTLNLLPLEMFPKTEFKQWDRHTTYFEAQEAGWKVKDNNFMGGNRYRRPSKDLSLTKDTYNNSRIINKILVTVGGLLHRVRYNRREDSVVIINGGIVMDKMNTSVGILQFPKGVTIEHMAIINAPESVSRTHVTFLVQNKLELEAKMNSKLPAFVFMGRLIPENAMTIDVANGRISIDLAVCDLESTLKRFSGFIAPNTYHNRTGVDVNSEGVIKEAIRNSSSFLIFLTASERKQFLMPVHTRECINAFKVSSHVRYPMLDNRKTLVDYTRDRYPYHDLCTFAHHESTEIENARVPVYAWILAFN